MPGVGIGTIPQLGQPSGLNTPTTSMGQLGTQLGSLPTSQVGQLGGLGSVNPLGKIFFNFFLKFKIYRE